jgi:hypothetical protein
MSVFHPGRHASAALIAVACASSAAPAAPLVDAGQLRVIDDRLNRTGRPLLLPTSVRHDGSIIGDVLLTVAVDDSIQVERDALVALLTPHLNPQLIAVLATQPSAIPLVVLRSFEGISLTYERGTLELVLVTTADSGTDQTLSLRPRINGPPPLPPAPYSAYVNVTTLLNHAWESPTSPGHSGLSFNLEGAARFMDFVLEGEASLDGPLDSFICPVEASCTYAHSSGLKRQGTRLVKDLPEFNTRMVVGDLSYWGHPLQRGNDLVGFSVRHEAQKFGVNERLDSATTSMLSLDASADVEVIVNGAPLQRLRLKAGTYRLSDLPLNAGTNDVQLVVTTDTGERRIVRVKALNHDTMLAPGKNEWSFAAGVASYIRDHEREYVADDPVVNAHFRMGLNHQFTIGVHAQADAQVVMGGGGMLALTPFGLWGLSLAASMTTEDTDLTGYAATLSWEYLPRVEPGAGRQSIPLVHPSPAGHRRTLGGKRAGRCRRPGPGHDPGGHHCRPHHHAHQAFRAGSAGSQQAASENPQGGGAGGHLHQPPHPHQRGCLPVAGLPAACVGTNRGWYATALRDPHPQPRSLCGIVHDRAAAALRQPRPPAGQESSGGNRRFAR